MGKHLDGQPPGMLNRKWEDDVKIDHKGIGYKDVH
jgi:hypothetical protein